MIEFLKSKTDLSTKSVDILSKAIKTSRFKKGETLFEEGKHCNKLFFIKEGLARIYFVNEDGKDITEWFVPENNFATPVRGFISNEESETTCELLEDAIVSELKYDDLIYFLNHDHELAKISFFTLYNITSSCITLIRNLKFQPVKEKYNAMTELFPSVLYRAPAMHIASYLGTTPETLSRIRAGKI